LNESNIETAKQIIQSPTTLKTSIVTTIPSGALTFWEILPKAIGCFGTSVGIIITVWSFILYRKKKKLEIKALERD